MAKKKDSTTIKSITIPYFEGVNAIVASHLAKKEEFIHAEMPAPEPLAVSRNGKGTEG